MRGKICKELMKIAMQEAIKKRTSVTVPKIYNLLKDHYKKGYLVRIVKGKNVIYKHIVPLGELRKGSLPKNETGRKQVQHPKVQTGLDSKAVDKHSG